MSSVYSIRNRSMLLVALVGGAVVAGGLGGCAMRERTVGYSPIFPEPTPDAAMARRNFPPTRAEYENVAVIAWSTRAPFVSKEDASDAQRLVTEPLIFFGNLLVSPVSLAVAPPFTSSDQRAWRAVAVEPTSTAAPTYDSVVPAEPGPMIPAIRDDIFDGPSSHPGTLPTGDFKAKGREVRYTTPKKKPKPAPTLSPAPTETPAPDSDAPMSPDSQTTPTPSTAVPTTQPS